MMKRMMAIAVAVGTVIAGMSVATEPVQAAQGCGKGAHRGPRGRCISNRQVVVRERYVVGRNYPGRGYYYQNRWYRERYRDGNGWRYR